MKTKTKNIFAASMFFFHSSYDDEAMVCHNMSSSHGLMP
jgi:hypothetical protein